MLKYLFDSSLTLNEKGLLAILLNISSDFEITIKNLQKLSSNSTYITKKTLQKLKKKGYLKVEQVNHSGAEFQYRYEAYMTPTVVIRNT